MRFLFSLLLWHSCFIIVDERPNRKKKKKRKTYTQKSNGGGGGGDASANMFVEQPTHTKKKK